MSNLHDSEVVPIEGQDIEESSAKCFACSSSLSYVEHMLYGNRCRFCADNPKRIGLLDFLTLAYYDWRIDRAAERLTRIPDGAMFFLGALANAGYIDVNMARTVKARRSILKNIRKAGRDQLSKRFDEPRDLPVPPEVQSLEEL